MNPDENSRFKKSLENQGLIPTKQKIKIFPVRLY